MDKLTVYCGSTSYDVLTSAKTFQHNMSEAWVANAETQYNAMMAVMEDISASGVPFFLSTDQHGRSLTQHCWMANTDPTIKNISLGDTVGDCFSLDAIQKIINQTSGLPNFIMVPGNHDFKKNTTDATLNPTTYNAINSAYISDGMRKYNRYGYGSVVDESRNVKWLIIQPYAIIEDPNDTSAAGFTTKIGTEQAKWLTRELSTNDGYDIIILMHAPLGGDYVGRSGEVRESTDGTYNDLETVMKNRVSGSTGTYMDSDGVSHTYDFSNLDGKLLGMLHGHLHQEVWRTEGGLTAYCANGPFDGMNCLFGMFDRHNKKLRIWQFNDTTVYDELILDIGLTD